MKKERLFFLDFIRAIAVIAILLTHFNAVYLLSYPPEAWDKIVVTYKVCNLYIGDFGVALFFIVSGAALMHVYDEKLELKTFYKKRFLAIYPMFWMAYFIGFIYLFYVNKGFDTSIPKRNIIYTILGFDGYLTGVVPNFYILGEWFLGCIVLIYVVFPLLRWGVQKHPIGCAIITLLLYVWSVWIYNGTLNRVELITTRLPEILFGMYFVKYIKKVNVPMLVVSVCVLVLNTIFAPSWLASFQTTYVGIASFCVLVFISKYLDFSAVRKICSCISKYSYAIFLVHHVIIDRMTSTFDLATLTRTGSYILFITCCVVIAFFAKILYIANDKSVQWFRKVKSEA